MASTELAVTVTAQLPWWWKIYIEAARFCDDLGIDIDAETCAAFILKHTKVRLQ